MKKIRQIIKYKNKIKQSKTILQFHILLRFNFQRKEKKREKRNSLFRLC